MTTPAAPTQNTRADKIRYDFKLEKWIFDKKQISYDKKVNESVIGSEQSKQTVYHVSPLYMGQPFVKIVTPICFCSGLYVVKDNVSGKKSITFCIWLYRDWSEKEIKKKPIEEKHEAFWKELHACCSLLDTEPYASVRSTIAIPTTRTDDEDGSQKPVKMTTVLRRFVTLPTYRKGHKNAGNTDPTRPPRVKANVWLAKIKESAAKPAAATIGASAAPPALRALPSGDQAKSNSKDKTWEGQRLLCEVEHLNGTPLAMEELFERPFLAKFTLVWTGDFFGGYKVHQLKASGISVAELLDKKSMAGMTKEERDDAQDEYMQYRQDRENEEGSKPATNPESGEEQGGEGGQGEDATPAQPPQPAPSGRKDKKKTPKMTVNQVLGNDDEQDG